MKEMEISEFDTLFESMVEPTRIRILGGMEAKVLEGFRLSICVDLS